MPRLRLTLLSLLLALSPAGAFAAPPAIIDFPCSRNLADGRVLVDGPQWDAKLRELGYQLEDGAYVPWRVLRFSQTRQHDAIWAEGECRLELLPVTK